MISLLILIAICCVFMIGYGIKLIVKRENKNLGIILLIIGFVIPLIGLSICGYMLMNLNLGGMH